jgi:5-methyltetrahydropteroyltriglutamate--homocysteine methyltransferase
MTTATSTNLNTIRFDTVGSLLRPAELKDAFAKFGEGALSADGLKQAQDKAVRAIIARQEELGLPVVTDGEFRRWGFQDSFGEAVSGFDSTPPVYRPTQPGGARPGQRNESGPSGRGPAVAHRLPAKERLKLVRNIVLEEFVAANAMSHTPVKVALIGPDRISQRFEWENSKAVYADMDAFMADVVAIERQMITELVNAGCKYVHIDAPGYTAYVDPPLLERMRSRGEDPVRNMQRSIKADNDIIAGFPGVTFGIHICRGNGPGWHREGHYDAIAEQLFTGLNHQRLLLEYDTERAGSFEPLRFVPKGKVAVLGLVSTKVQEVEDAGGLKRRIGEAAKFLPLDQLALSPQCGFASGLGGNLTNDTYQWDKFRVIMQVIRDMWGG